MFNKVSIYFCEKNKNFNKKIASNSVFKIFDDKPRNGAFKIFDDKPRNGAFKIPDNSVFQNKLNVFSI